MRKSQSPWQFCFSMEMNTKALGLYLHLRESLRKREKKACVHFNKTLLFILGGGGSWLEKNRTWYICEINVHESNISWEAALLISPGDTHSKIPAVFLISAGLSRRCLPVSQSYFAEAPKFQSQEL